MQQDLILIIDLGGTDNAGLTRSIRKLGVYSESSPHDISLEELESKIEKNNLKGLILYGGANRIVDGQAVDVGPFAYSLGLPVLSVDHEDRGGQASKKLSELPSTEAEILEVLSDFVLEDCMARANWNMTNFVADQILQIREEVGDKKVLLALSGGVDSSVVAGLLLKAIPGQLYCVHVDHGLMRKGESQQVEEVFRPLMGDNLVCVEAADRFLDKLAGQADPEKKRKIIGGEFIRIFEEEARKLDGIEYLAQGTIYPDIIESGTKTAKVIKSHHNVGGLPEDMDFALIEPLKFLFKDEVRECGLELGLPEDMIFRQPFPGPGLGVRCLGAITRERLHYLVESDAILREEFAKVGLDKKVWQYFTVVPEFKSVGKRGDSRTYEYPVIIRAVNTVDALVAHIELIDWSILQKIADRILSEVPGINRVLYDLTPKPPGTIEWE